MSAEDGGGFDADFEIVLPVDHRVDGVVGDGPDCDRGEDQPCQSGYFVGQGGEGHRHSPSEGEPQAELGQGCPSLHEGIAGGEQDPADGVEPGQGVEHRYQGEGDQPQEDEKRQGLGAADLSAGQGSVAGAFDVGIQLSIGEIVDDAAGGAHDENADHEDDHDRRSGVAVARNPKRP